MGHRPGEIVRAVYDFFTNEPSELPLLVGDIIQVKEFVDKQWCLGVCNSHEGNFPSGFVIDLKIPILKDDEQLFAVTSDFIAQENGDLTMKKGDLVVGNEAIDSNWWKGEINGQSGIFPLTHVWKIDKALLPSSCDKRVAMKAKVNMNMKAQMDEEIDLYQDDIVEIIEEVEKGWYRGECNGKIGIFPASFVTILPESPTLVPLIDISNSTEANNTSLFNNHSGYDCVNSGITPYGRTLFPFTAEYPNELSFNSGEIVNLIRYVDTNWIEGEIDGRVGIFPAGFINIVVDCPDSKLSVEKANLNNNIEMSFPPDTYGRVTRDFCLNLQEDVSLKDGDTVTLIRKIDPDWYEVVTDNGESVVCPESYIEVIGSSPPSYNEVMAATYSFPTNQSVNDSEHKNNSSLNDSLFSHPTSHNSSLSSQLCYDLDNQKRKKVDRNCSFGSSEADSSNRSCRYDSPNNFNKTASSNDDSGLDCNRRNENNFSSSFSPGVLNQNLQEVGSWNTGIYDNQGKDDQSSIFAKTPTRPPPPINGSTSPSVSSSNRSTINSARNSTLSACSSESLEGNDLEEIKKLIAQKEQILKIRIACKNKLEGERNQTSINFVSNEMKVQLSQLHEEIDQLNSDIADLNLKVHSANGLERPNSEDSKAREEEVARKKEIEQKRREQEKIKKMREQRECIITEVLQTERDYLSDLKLLQEMFLRNPSEAKEKGIDVNSLFGNLDEVIDVAGRLLKRLQKVSRESQSIGECFVELSDDMKQIYGHYCRNHDEVNNVIDKIDPRSPAGKFLSHKLELMKRQTNCFDLPAMLIKPVQRILKYPLLLNELLKCTEESHPDKEWLVKATNLMIDVAAAVNEFKRRKDLVFKYRKQADTSLSGRISKFSIHSMAKKTSRLGMRLSSSIGLKTVTRDQEFEKVERRFSGLEKSLKIFQKDICDFIKKSEELVKTAASMSEEIAEFYQEKKTQVEVEQFCSTHRTIVAEYWETFKQAIERNVNSPIKLLLQKFCGSTNLIQKRYDKLLDFESASSKVEKNKDAPKIKMLQDNQTCAKHNYEALNSQLLDDLPKLCNLSVDILYDCIRFFLKAKKNFIGKEAFLLFKLMDLPLLLGSQGNSILETFQVKHTLIVDSMSHLSILPKELQSCIKADTLKRNTSSRGSRLNVSSTVKSQTHSQKIKVKSAYPQAVLYTACENFDAVDIMDISLRKDDVVGVIKQQDPMGKKLRWFVDNGDCKGFVPAKCLIKFIPSLSSPSSNISIWDTPQSRTSTDLYSKPQKIKVENQQPKKNMLQPVRPAQVSPSLRTVPPSKYPTQQPIPVSNSRDSTPQPSNVVAKSNQSIKTSSICVPDQVGNVSSSSAPRQPVNFPISSVPDKPVNVSRSSAPHRPVNIFVPDKSVNDSRSSAPHQPVNISVPDTSVNVSRSSVPVQPVNAFSSSVLIHSADISLMEPEHRYEEIDDDVSGGQFSSTDSPGSVIREFDPYSSLHAVGELYDNVPDNLNDVYSSHRYEDIPEDGYYSEIPNDGPCPNASEVSEEYYYGKYSFAPNGPNQLSLREGQVVMALHKCDLNDNSDWWFVEDRHGNKGYVPASYLKKYH